MMSIFILTFHQKCIPTITSVPSTHAVLTSQLAFLVPELWGPAFRTILSENCPPRPVCPVGSVATTA